nr:uncharacterized protein LOC111503237 [Leptinotarsa decemlineata]
MVLEILVGLSYKCFKQLPRWLRTGLAKRARFTLMLALFSFCIFLIVAFFFLKMIFITMIEIKDFLKSDSNYDMDVIAQTGLHIAGLLFIMIAFLIPFIIGVLIHLHMHLGGEADAEDLLLFYRRGGLFH